MIFRQITKEDIPLLTSSKNYGFTDGWTEEMLLSAFDGGRFFGFILERENAPAGYVTLDKGLDDADIEEIFVFPQFRKLGVATLLIKKVVEELKVQGINRLLLEVREGNHPARRLYEKNNFIKINERKKYYQNGENAVIYLKEF